MFMNKQRFALVIDVLM